MSTTVEQKGTEGRYLDAADVDDALKSGVRYFGNRICPFAHRAWWAAEETGFAMDYIHINLQDTKPKWYPEKVNVGGTVPTLYVEGTPVFESAIVAQYIDEATGNKLWPTDLLDRANARLLQTHFGERVIGKGYQFLRTGDEEAWNALKEQLEKFDVEYSALKKENGPYFSGEALSLVEISILPFIHRFSILLKHYHQRDIFADAKTPGLAAAHAAVTERDAFKKTILKPEEFVMFYSGYVSK
jgi:glutathione S-transferase